MSIDNIKFLKKTDKKLSSIQLINEYKNKYNNKTDKSETNIKSILTRNNNNENAKCIAMNDLNKYEKDILIKNNQRKIIKNKINTFRNFNKNNIYLETEKEISNNPKPDPIPIRINKNNNYDYNDIMQNTFYNKFIQNIQNNINMKKEFEEDGKVNTFEIEKKYNKSYTMNDKLNVKEKNKKNNNYKYNNFHINIECNNKNKLYDRNDKNHNYKELNNKNDLRLLFVLKNLDLEYLINCFNKHYIKFLDLFQLNKSDLLEMEIPIGPRNRIINFIEEFKIFGKKYDLKELKIFFQNIKNNKELKMTSSENNIKNISNFSIFNNYYQSDVINEKQKNKNNIEEEEDDKRDNLFNKYNSMSNLLTMNKNNQIKNRNRNYKKKKYENCLTFNNEKKEKSIGLISPIIKKEENKTDKKNIYRSNSVNSQKMKEILKIKENNDEKNNNNKISEKRRKFYTKFTNINNEIKVFENHLKEMRKKSQETNKKVNNLLIKGRNHTFLDNVKIKFNRKNNHNLNNTLKYGIYINKNNKRKKSNYNDYIDNANKQKKYSCF